MARMYRLLIFMGVALACLSTISFAYDEGYGSLTYINEHVPGSWTRLGQATTRVFHLSGGTHHVRRLRIEARLNEYYSMPAEVQVWVGDRIAKVVRIGRPAYYENSIIYDIEINETISKFKLRHLAGGDVDVLNMTALQSLQNPDLCEKPLDLAPYLAGAQPPQPVFCPPQKVLSARTSSMARQAEEAVDALMPKVDPHVYADHLAEIKLLASTADATAAAASVEVSAAVIEALTKLRDAIAARRNLIDEWLKIPDASKDATKLLKAQFQIDDWLQKNKNPSPVAKS